VNQRPAVELLCDNAVLARSVTEALQRRASIDPQQPGLARDRPAQRDPAVRTTVLIDRSVTTGDHHRLKDADAAGRTQELARGASGPLIHVRTHASTAIDAALTIRTTTAYGVTDDPLTAFLLMMRTLPTVPVLGDSLVLQPIWHEDLANAVAASVDLIDTAAARTFDVAGPDAVTQAQLYERVAALIDRRPLRIPVPAALAAPGLALAAAVDAAGPLRSWLGAFHDASAIIGSSRNQLSSVLHVVPTPLDRGLVRLITDLPEQTPFDGVGAIEVKRFSADIQGARYRAGALLRLFRSHFKDVMPIAVGVEPATPQAEITAGATLTMALPGRGHVQVRVEEVTDAHVVLATLIGHAVAGFVRFRTHDLDGRVRFDVMTCDSAGSSLDWVAMAMGSSRLQDANWRHVVEHMVSLSGGTTDTIHMDSRTLSDEEAAAVEHWIQRIIERRHTPEKD
jgi:hypothetical protein